MRVNDLADIKHPDFNDVLIHFTGRTGVDRVEPLVRDNDDWGRLQSIVKQGSLLGFELPGTDDEVYWASGYRDLVLGGTEGQDNLGYDIRVVGDTGPRYFEVKATPGDDLSFDLSPGEVEFARRHRSDYTILYVRHALQPTQFSILQLPNPFSSRGRDRYRESGGLHLEFWLDT